MPGPGRRSPQHDRPGSVVHAEALAGDIEADDGDDGEQALVGPLTQSLHRGVALWPHGHEHVGTKKQDQAESKYNQAHGDISAGAEFWPAVEAKARAEASRPISVIVP